MATAYEAATMHDHIAHSRLGQSVIVPGKRGKAPITRRDVAKSRSGKAVTFRVKLEAEGFEERLAQVERDWRKDIVARRVDYLIGAYSEYYAQLAKTLHFDRDAHLVADPDNTKRRELWDTYIFWYNWCRFHDGEIEVAPAIPESVKLAAKRGILNPFPSGFERIQPLYALIREDWEYMDTVGRVSPGRAIRASILSQNWQHKRAYMKDFAVMVFVGHGKSSLQFRALRSMPAARLK